MISSYYKIGCKITKKTYNRKVLMSIMLSK